MRELLELIGTGAVSDLMVWRWDRLSRDRGDFSTLVKLFDRHGVQVHSVNEETSPAPRADPIDNSGAVSLRRAGRMHHISIGRAHKHLAVIMLIDDLDIRVINTDTGELLRALTLDPTIGYQPRFQKR